MVQLKRGNINYIKYKRVLINTLINKVYLYNDNIIIVFNPQGKPLEKNTKNWSVREFAFGTTSYAKLNSIQ